MTSPGLACDGDKPALGCEYDGGSGMVPHQSFRLLGSVMMTSEVGFEPWLKEIPSYGSSRYEFQRRDVRSLI